MARSTVILSLMLVVAASDVYAETQDGGKVLLILREGETKPDVQELMLTKEVGVMVTMLEKAGFEVVVASVSGKPFTGTNTRVKSDTKLADVRVADYDGFIMPCMTVDTPPPEASRIVKQAVAAGKPVAAQYGAVYTLAEAGVLAGRRYAIFSDPEKDHRFVGATYSGSGIVQDGNIITSGICPSMAKENGLTDGTHKLTQALIDELKKK
jgi:putative intracellular protease/amidase